ncbi:PREDICTED: zinc finger HIT domain-containing protein 2 [Fragaria vesca subsp. vesca]|uniref:zinc finger HIT domain-containing protein 2 n=1 Tax=Fragaria vesca subsp. vesca TaxID=101020 RepID=UPI0002C36610|nr:PREDICTED: zinc finger HIT domain-containing protein 2 [Fragaria vesca subsp. vesca]
MADSIITSEKPSTSSPLDPPSRIVCHVCQKQFSQYTCPRCNSRYCSLHCYKSHNIRCTESFMRDNVVGELGQLRSNDETKQKMLDILKRFHSEEQVADCMDEDVDADSALSEETIQKVLAGGEVSLDDLPAEEKKLFQRAVASGELSKMIKPWDPWWLKPSARTISFSKEGTQLIQPLAREDEPMSSEDDLESSLASEIPPGPETPLPPLSKLSSAKPSPFLAVHLVDIIYSYCFALRLYNGDWQSDATGSAMVVLSVSSVLGQGGQPETVLEALSYCLEQTCSSAFRQMGGLQFGLGLVDDVISLLTLGTPALLCLLCDLQRMVQAGETELKSEKPRKSRRVEIRSKLKQAERKIYFLMCWVHEQPGEAWSSLGAIVRAEKSSAMNYEAVSLSHKPDNKPEPRSKALIEEIKDI